MRHIRAVTCEVKKKLRDNLCIYSSIPLPPPVHEEVSSEQASGMVVTALLQLRLVQLLGLRIHAVDLLMLRHLRANILHQGLHRAVGAIVGGHGLPVLEQPQVRECLDPVRHARVPLLNTIHLNNTHRKMLFFSLFSESFPHRF